MSSEYKLDQASSLNSCKQENNKQIYYNSNLTRIIGWNCRSLNKDKELYINYIISLHEPDFIILWETWLDHKPNLIDNRYETYQTDFAKHQGICVIAKQGYTSKVCTNNEPYIIWVQINRRNQIFVVGAYFKESIKTKILEWLRHLLNRIRKTYLNPTIYLFGDFNLDKNFNIELIESKLNLIIDEQNKTLITRSQSLKGKIINSTLDLFLSTEPIETITTLDKASSDHFSMLITIKTPSRLTTKLKTMKVIKRANIGAKEVDEILKNKQWPTNTQPQKLKELLQTRQIIRPIIKLQKQANKIFNKKYNWESKEINLRTLRNENFKEYIKNLDLWKTNDASKFYKIINSLIKYKNKGKLVKGIKDKEVIVYGKPCNEIVTEYYQNIVNWSRYTLKIRNNGIFNYKIDIERAIDRIANGKAIGWDYIQGEMLKLKHNTDLLKVRLQDHFRNYVMTGDVPEYFMNARLILLSKDDSDTLK